MFGALGPERGEPSREVTRPLGSLVRPGQSAAGLARPFGKNLPFEGGAVSGPLGGSQQPPRQPTAPTAWHVDPNELPAAGDERVGLLRQLVGELILRNRFEVPPLPVVAQDILAAAGRPNTSAQELAFIAHKDAFVAGRILKLANSAHYGFRRPASDLAEAIVRIGFDELRNIIFALAMVGRVFRSKDFPEFAAYAWRDALAAAIAAGQLAEKTRAAKRSRAFLGGLLHNVGAGVVMMASVELLRKRPQDRNDIVAGMNEIARGLYAEVGLRVANHWKLDPGLSAAIRWHLDPRGAECDRNLVVLVGAGHEIAHRVLNPDEQPPQPLALHPVIAAMRLPARTLIGTYEGLPEQLAGYESSVH